MTIKNVAALTDKVNQLRDELRTVEWALEEALKLRRDDPVNYIGQLIYANKVSNGGVFGYDYGTYGDTERERAQKVIDVAGGDLTIAENIVATFHIR